jgi:hypothetical protein
MVPSVKFCLCLYVQVFVANPNKPREVKVILAKNHGKLLELLHNLSAGKGNYAFKLDSQRGHVIFFEIVFIRNTAQILKFLLWTSIT